MNIGKKLNIAIVCFPTIGGSGAVATALGLELAKRGHNIHFIAHEMLFKLRDEAADNVTFHLVEDVKHQLFEDAPIYVMSLANKIAEVSRRYNIDIIHSHYSLPHAMAAVIARDMPGTKAKVINTFHGTDVNVFATDFFVKEVLGYSVNKCDGLTSVAKALAVKARKSFKIPNDKKIEVIYNWVTPVHYPGSKAKELKGMFAPNDEKIICHISNFRPVKRISDVIEIFRGIDKHVNSKLILVGDGPEQRIAHRLITKYNLLNKVHIMGIQTNVFRMLAISDLFLLPSQSEAFSVAALEAMCLGIPVISSKVGGMSEMIAEGKTGYLAKVGDIKTMVKKGIEILSNSELHKEMKKNTIEKVQNNYTAEIAVQAYEKYYYEVLSQN